MSNLNVPAHSTIRFKIITDNMGRIKKIAGHLRNIFMHKWWVFHYGRKLGMGWWQLLKHDLSKLSPVEFWESVKYYQGTSSPIPVCKKENGYSEAWQHHKGRNPHHYEYWTDNYDTGITLIPMPFKYVEEMLADWFAAGRTYQGKEFTFESQREWWKKKKAMNPSINKFTIDLIDAFFQENDFTKDHFKRWRENKGYWSFCYNMYQTDKEQGNYPIWR